MPPEASSSSEPATDPRATDGTRLREAWAFEVAHKLRRPSTWLYGLVLLGFPQLLQLAATLPGRVVNAPLAFAGATFFAGVAGVLITAALMAESATRDWALPERRREALFGRFLGALTVNVLLLLAVPVALHLSTLLPYDTPSPVIVLPFDLRSYLEPLVITLLPTTFTVATLAFTVAALTRRKLPAYLALAGAFLGSALLAELVAATGNKLVVSLLDPFGYIPVEQHVQGWTQAERDTLHVGLPLPLVLNRALWVAVGAGLLALLHATFRFDRTEGFRPQWSFRES